MLSAQGLRHHSVRLQAGDDWEQGILGQAVAAGAEVLMDESVVHDMPFPSLEAYWQVGGCAMRSGVWMAVCMLAGLTAVALSVQEHCLG